MTMIIKNNNNDNHWVIHINVWASATRDISGLWVRKLVPFFSLQQSSLLINRSVIHHLQTNKVPLKNQQTHVDNFIINTECGSQSEAMYMHTQMLPPQLIFTYSYYIFRQRFICWDSFREIKLNQSLCWLIDACDWILNVNVSAQGQPQGFSVIGTIQ